MAARKRTIYTVILILLCTLSPAFCRDANVAGVPPDVALARLKEGNTRFQSGKSQYPHVDAPRLAATARQGQKPFATVLSCSDSRVPVELIFDQGVGDVFVVRVAGNVCGGDELGTIEYGVDHLETPLLVVLGHSKCGAVTAAVTGAEVHGHVLDLVQRIRPAREAAEKANPTLHGAALVPAAIEANVWEAIKKTLAESPAVRERVSAGKLRIVGAVYHIEDGRVQWLGELPDQGRLLKSAGRGHATPLQKREPVGQH